MSNPSVKTRKSLRKAVNVEKRARDLKNYWETTKKAEI